MQYDGLETEDHGTSEEADDGILSHGVPVDKREDDLGGVGEGNGQEKRENEGPSRMRTADIAFLERASGDGGADEKIEEDECGVSIM